MKHYNLKITGKVQGVFFRTSAKEEADKLNIKGFVRNEPDGSVYIEAEGEEKNIKAFIEWCRKGPSAASVDTVMSDGAPMQNFFEFEVRR